MRPPNAAWLVAIASLAPSACGDSTAQTSGDGDAGEDEAPAQDGICGDGLVNAEGEACDDANDREGDGCNSDCRASGERVWCLDDFGPPDVDTTPTALAVSPSGDVAVIGTISAGGGAFTGWVEVVDAAGAARWSKRFPNAGASGVGFLSDGSLAISLHETGSTGSTIALFSAEGTPGSASWTGDSGQTIHPGALAIGFQDRIIVVGRSETPDEAWVATFSKSLALEGQATYRSSQGISTTARAVAPGRAGTIILATDVILGPGTDSGSPPTTAAVASLLPSGELAWDHVFDSANLLVQVKSVASQEDGSIIVTGFTGGDLSFRVWTAALSAAGELTWEFTDESDFLPSSGTSVTPTSTSDFVLTSFVSREASYAFEAVFGRYDHEHVLLWEREYEHSAHEASAMLSARSRADRSFLLAGILIRPGVEGPDRPWLCKYTE